MLNPLSSCFLGAEFCSICTPVVQLSLHDHPGRLVQLLPTRRVLPRKPSTPPSPQPRRWPQDWGAIVFNSTRGERFRFHTAHSNEKVGQMIIFIHVKILIVNVWKHGNDSTLTNIQWGRKDKYRVMGADSDHTDSGGLTPLPLPLHYLEAHALTFLSLCSLTCKMRIQIVPVS